MTDLISPVAAAAAYPIVKKTLDGLAPPSARAQVRLRNI